MQKQQRFRLALLVCAFAICVVLSVQFALGRLTNPSFVGDMIRILLTTFLFAFAAGFAVARLIGRSGLSGFLIWLATALVATIIGAILPPIITGWPITIRAMLDGGDLMAGLQSLAAIPALGVAFLSGAVYFNKIIALIWVAGLIITHAIARRIAP